MVRLSSLTHVGIVCHAENISVVWSVKYGKRIADGCKRIKNASRLYMYHLTGLPT